ncbi:hypothetical protein QUF58_09460 [Anaerolineales bacterium HSG24]|nr:hypothetical protein [Anaerolineales bacterium HSG24]
MRAEYDFSKSIKNPYAKSLKKQITLSVEVEAIDFFVKLARELDIPYQNLINLYLLDCVRTNHHLSAESLVTAR